ncbi:two-component system response regulator [Pseudanabaena yagii]|uniref:EAL domain-containing response regulator n=1 Tax=Pseudanabaena yagii GIHE-NHR1 TaxID=2722753 RepID=A0ABX1LM83_9CYAN|nr:EAL domain-containing response regulator [Pseudanabaena yagii]NMF57227.1 EAL domain-containing response regulator [Pseudanabaena yagii GIHE-NHR1]
MKKILVIEDSKEVCDNIQQILELEDFNVITAINGRIGIELAQRQNPDLIICDVMMPEIDGYGVLETLQKDVIARHIPFIFLTAKAEYRSMRQGFELGADDYLTKPFSPNDLLKAISVRLHKKTFAANYLNEQSQDHLYLWEHEQIQQIQQQIDGAKVSLLSSVDLTLLEALKRSLDKLEDPKQREIFIFYQPQINLKSGRISGIEALVRWQHPEYGFITPSKFIPIAETTGLIRRLDTWVLQQACQNAHQWQSIQENLTVSVNISANQFRNPDFYLTVQQTLIEQELKPSLLNLEISENIVIQDSNLTIDRLNKLRSLGVRIAIDNFGTGHSSLICLQKFLPNFIKLDQCFVNNIDVNLANATIVKSLVEMAHNLNCQAVGVGVEVVAELNFLKTYNCDMMQGFLFSNPLPCHKIEQLLIGDKRLISY